MLNNRGFNNESVEALSIWGTERAQEYEPFAVGLKSDKVAYEVSSWLVFQSLIYQLRQKHSQGPLDLSELNVLDFGCFQGASTEWLRRNTGAYIVGVDSSANDIEQAKARHEQEGMEFLYVGKTKLIPTPRGPYHSVSMTFVHPTISSFVDLDRTIGKISRVTAEGGSLVMLGLNPQSLDERYKFKFYGHTLPEGQDYIDGKQFNNELRLSEQEVIKFQDYCWTEETLKRLLEKHGYINIRIINLSKDLDNHVGTVLRAAIDKYTENDVWQDEWTAPLYQVIYADKPLIATNN